MKKKAPTKPRPPCPDGPPKPRPKAANLALADALFGIFGFKRVAKFKPQR